MIHTIRHLLMLFFRLSGSLRIAFCVWSVSLIIHLQAQPPAPNYTLIGKNEGLPEAAVNGLTEDTEGFVWFGNRAALCRWDGHHFQRHFLNDKNGLPMRDFKWTASWDSLHFLFLQGGEYSLFNTRSLEHWRIFDKAVPDYKPIKKNLHLPNVANGMLWYSDMEGVKLWDLKKKVFKLFPNPDYAHNNTPDASKNFLSFPDGSAFFQSESSVIGKKPTWYVVSPAHDTMRKMTLPYPFKEHIYNILMNLNDTLSFTISHDYVNSRKVLWQIGLWNLKTRQWKKLVLPLNQILSGGWVSVLRANDNEFQFGDVSSLQPSYRLNLKTEQISLDDPIFNAISPYSRSILEHSSGVLLQDILGTSIAKFQGTNGLFQLNYKVDSLLKNLQLHTNAIVSTEDFIKVKGKTFIATQNWFIELFDNNSIVYEKPLTYKSVYNFLNFSKDTVLLGTQVGAYLFNPNSPKTTLIPFPSYPNKPPQMDAFATSTTFRDSHDDIWMGIGAGNGVARLDMRRRVFKYYPYGKGSGQLPIRYPSTIAEDKVGNLWMGCQSGGGLVRWNRVRDSFEVVEKMKGSMSNGYDYPTDISGGLAFDKQGRLYIGCHYSGLLRYDTLTQKFENWRTENGLPGDCVTDICFDAEDCLWVATAEGLSRFDPKTGKFKNFYKEHGLPDNMIHTLKRWDTEGFILYIGSNSYRLLDIRDLKKNNPTGPLLLTRFDVNNKPYKVTFGEPIQLTYAENNLDIEWTVINFADGPLNRFAYRFLNGRDSTWQDLGYNNLAHIVGMGTGTYRLQLRVILNGGETFLSPELTVVIRPPFWKSGWFFLLLAGLLVGLIFFYFRLRIRQIRREAAMRKNISSDLHDDIGAALSNINILTQLARQKSNDPPAVLAILNRIEEESSTSSESLDDIIWSVNPQNDSMERVLSRMRQYANEVFESKNIEGTVSFDGDLANLTLQMDRRRDFYLIFKEALNNLSKYAQCREATIKVKINENKIVLTITDNGVGFDPLSKNEGNGQKTMRQRAERLEGKLTIESEKGKGTKVRLSLPIHIN